MSDVKKFDKKSSNQIIRFDGRNSFLEVMDSAFIIGKVRLNFIQYDMSKPQGERYTNTISIYIDIEEFETLAHDIKLRIIDRDAMKAREAQKTGGFKYCKEVYLDLGSTTKEELAARSESREDGKDESRQFKITPGDKMPWVLSAEKGAGKRLETGLIAPDGKPDTRINIPLSDKDFRKFAIVVTNEIQAWRIAKRMVERSEDTMSGLKDATIQISNMVNTIQSMVGKIGNMVSRIQSMVEKIGVRLFSRAS